MWLILESELERVVAAREAFFLHPESIDTLKVSAASPMVLRYGTATIKIDGVLVAKRDPMLDYFGIEHTAYADISAQVAQAQKEGAKRIVLEVDSGGGTIDGLFEAMGSIASASVPVKAVAGGTMASAAYMIASQASGGISARSEMSLIGSLGVATAYTVSTYRKDIANTDSPKKRPDVSTEEGIAVVREELDDIYSLLAEKIAAGRGVDVETVRKNYGAGAVMTARKAKALKIIDSIESTTAKTAANVPAANGEKKMDLETLKAEHPALYATIQADAKAGIEKERARCVAHIELGKTGSMEAAISAVKSGDELTMAVQKAHFEASLKKNEISARAGEAVTTGLSSASAAGSEAKFDKAEAAKKFEAAHPGWKVEVR